LLAQRSSVAWRIVDWTAVHFQNSTLLWVH